MGVFGGKLGRAGEGRSREWELESIGGEGTEGRREERRGRQEVERWRGGEGVAG